MSSTSTTDKKKPKGDTRAEAKVDLDKAAPVTPRKPGRPFGTKRLPPSSQRTFTLPLTTLQTLADVQALLIEQEQRTVTQAEILTRALTAEYARALKAGQKEGRKAGTSSVVDETPAKKASRAPVKQAAKPRAKATSKSAKDTS